MAAPLLPATLTIEFGADTQVGGGGYELSRDNTGGTITGGAGTNELTGTNNSHFQIDAAGVITVTQAGRTANLANGPYSLTATVYSADGSDAVALTINISLNTQHIGTATTAGTTKPTSTSQMTNAMKTTTTTSGANTLAIGYSGKNNDVTIKLRAGVSLTYSSAWLPDQTRTGIITWISEDTSAPATLLCWASSSASRKGLWRNMIVDGLTMNCPYWREANQTGTVEPPVFAGNNATGAVQGTLVVRNCTFAANDRSIMGEGISWRGIWSALSSGASITIENCTWTGMWFRCWSSVSADPTVSVTLLNNNMTGFISDAMVFAGAYANVTIDGNNAYDQWQDCYQTGFQDAAYLTKASPSNQADGTKCTIAFQVYEFAASARIIDYAGIQVRTDSSRKLVVSVYDTSGVLIGTMTSATALSKFCRNSVLISIDTTGTSRMAIRRETSSTAAAPFGGTWVAEASTFTAASQNIDLTGAVTVGGTLGAVKSGLSICWMHVTQGTAPDTTSAAARNAYFDSTSGNVTATLNSALRTAAGTNCIIDLFFTDDQWAAGANNGSGGTLTAVLPTTNSSIENAHGDLIQFSTDSSSNIYDNGPITITNNVLAAGNNPDTSQGTRYARYSLQGMFLEDITPKNYRSVSITNNLLITGHPSHGISLYCPINCTVDNNTLVRNPLGSYTSTASFIALRKQTASDTGSGNTLRKNFCYGTVIYDAGFTDTVKSGNIESSTENTVGDNAWSNCFNLDGGTYDLSTPNKMKTVFGRKAGGPLATGAIGATFTVDVPGSAPENTAAPTIAPGADNYVGTTLSVSNFGTWTNSPSSYSVQWYKDGVLLGGATSSTYVTAAAGSFTATVTATNASGSSSAVESNAIAITAAPTYVANNDLLELDYASSATLSVLGNDLNLDNVTAVASAPTGLTVAIQADKSIGVRAAPGFTGTAEMTVTVTGNSGAVTKTSTLTVTVPTTKTFTITTS